MKSEEIPPDFWRENVSKSHGKHNIAPEAWERICKIRNRPVRLIKDHIIGEDHKIHMVIPKGYRGFLIDYPEAFYLSDEDLSKIATYSQPGYSALIPASFFGYEGPAFLRDGEYEVIPPFFDLMLASSSDLIKGTVC